jgi:hypothetical protein
MKRMTTLLGASLLVSLLATVTLRSGSALYAQEAFIRNCAGTVELRAPGETEWTPARPGQELSLNTMISTGFKSTAILTIGNSTLIVRPLTRLTLEELRTLEANEPTLLHLQTGRVRAEVKAPSGGKVDFTIRNPSATASVRGTAFDFDGVNLIVTEGKVHVTGSDRSSVYVGAGHGTVSNPETGRTINAAETARAELTPALPTAVEQISEPPAIVPGGADFGFGFSWE